MRNAVNQLRYPDHLINIFNAVHRQVFFFYSEKGFNR